LEHAPRHPNHVAVLADLDPELHGLPIGIPADVLGKVKNMVVPGAAGSLGDLYPFGCIMATAGQLPALVVSS
jgi:hypothetical protein